MFGSFFVVVQIKGCKGLSHAQEETLSLSLQAAIQNVKKSFPALDWDQMMDQEAGELYCDVGITIQPSMPATPLVGLWRLDCLEASFGAAGLYRGHLHTINTFSMYGGLQAEASPDRRARSHIAFLSTYNLSWEAVRPKDNQRTFFDEGLVYQRDNYFHYEVKEVHRILGEVMAQAYGVRWEVRIGGQALEPLTAVLDDQVGSFGADANPQPFFLIRPPYYSLPISWLPSQYSGFPAHCGLTLLVGGSSTFTRHTAL